jgi:hypothetical protein
MAKKNKVTSTSGFIEEEIVNYDYNDGMPKRQTLYQAYRRNYFSKDPDENLRLYNKARRGYEGKEKTVLISL